jgi:hypothetical protein
VLEQLGVRTLPSLELYADYDRRGIYDIFDPDSRFFPQRGIWGLQGIIPLPNRANDYALLVTYGQQQGDHRFDEGISTQGILRWQSRPARCREGAAIIQPPLKSSRKSQSAYD